LISGLARGVADDLRVQGLLGGIADAGEVGDLAGERLAVQALHVALGQGFYRAAHEDLDEGRRLRAHLVAHVAIR
jgi:hypothetical protein